MNKKESKFITELHKSWDYHYKNLFWFKIPDQPHTGFIRFDIKKPFDITACLDSTPIAIEAKSISKLKAFGLNDFQPAQIDGLTEAYHSGTLTLVALNVRQSADTVEGIKRMNRLYMFEWYDFHFHVSKSSIKAKTLDKLPYTEGSKGGFDLNVNPIITDIDSGTAIPLREMLFQNS